VKKVYESPLNTRYASAEMLAQFSPDKRFITWRLLWITLAQCQMELGLDITESQIAQLKEHVDDINYDEIEKIERTVKHDVISHIRAYAKQCPQAGGIIHLGATSCYVTDNADILIMKEALELIKHKIIAVIKNLKDFAIKYKDLPTLGLTHCQPAQLVTVGKRACLWIQDLLIDLEDLEYVQLTTKLLGSKGTTGTQASFLSLFNGDHDKVKQLESLIAHKLGQKQTISISGQTYTRKLDSRIMNVLASVAQSASKFSSDIRLLQSMGELEEPFECEQVGSSAMAYKRNPIRTERIASLARFAMINSLNPAITAASQWFERTLDDSANRRISIPEMFLTIDSILNIYLNVSSGLVIYPRIIEKHVKEQMPFMATENILMEAVKNGGDRQELHERIRAYSMQVSKDIKNEVKQNDLLDKIGNDEDFHIDDVRLQSLTDPSKYIGRSAQQVQEFIVSDVQPVLDKYSNLQYSIESSLRI